MSDDDEPSPGNLERGGPGFAECTNQLDERSVVRPQVERMRHACPCCRSLTLETRGSFDLCEVCHWEDDGQDDHDADEVRGGPNAWLSLTQARSNYAAFGACEERFKRAVRKPLPSERGDAG